MDLKAFTDPEPDYMVVGVGERKVVLPKYRQSLSGWEQVPRKNFLCDWVNSFNR